MPNRMHPEQVAIDETLVHRLLRAQHPDLADRPIVEVPSDGTVNAVYRLGGDLCARLPLQPSSEPALDHELVWLPWLGARLPFPVPEPVADGEPGEGYAFRWAVYRWIPGAVPDGGEPITEPGPLVDDIATLVAALRDLPVDDAPPQPSRRSLHDHDLGVRQALRHIGEAAATAEQAWDAALALPDHGGPPTWVHGDLFGPNVLIADGRIAGVLDWGCTGLGDPACDLALALVPLAGAARARLLDALGVDDETWARARGWVLRTAITGIPYYRRTNPGFVTRAHRNLEQALWGERGADG